MLLLFCVVISLVLFLLVMYYCESIVLVINFMSIFVMFWFVIVIMIMVGYGDMMLVMVVGKVFSVLCVVFGVCCVLVMLLMVIVMNFNFFYLKYKEIVKLKK